jgi:hypothetical protein
MTTLPVAHCANCQRELQPGWKFCIACGTPVPAPASETPANPAQLSPTEPPVPAEPAGPTEPAVPAEPPVPAEPAVLAEPVVPVPGPPEIPAAIRPRAEKLVAAHPVASGEEPRRRVNLAVVTSIVLGASGLALIVYLLVVVFGSRD